MAYSFFLLDRAAWTDPRGALSGGSNTRGAAAVGDQLTLNDYSGQQVTVNGTGLNSQGSAAGGTSAAYNVNGTDFPAGSRVDMNYGFVVQDSTGIQYFVGRVNIAGNLGGPYDGSVITSGWNAATQTWVGAPAPGTTFTLLGRPQNDTFPWYGNANQSISTARFGPYSSSAQLSENVAAPAVGTPGVAVPCFVAGTLIRTPNGDVAVEDLRVGDWVVTMDHGPQQVRWTGTARRVATGSLAPVLIRKGALGNDRDLRVSPQHRMLLSGWQAELLFGSPEVLATARSLINDSTILRVEGGMVDYVHILFDQHEIVFAEGAPSESFHPGAVGLSALDAATREEVLALFPAFATGDFSGYGPAARPSLKAWEAQQLATAMV